MDLVLDNLLFVFEFFIKCIFFCLYLGEISFGFDVLLIENKVRKCVGIGDIIFVCLKYYIYYIYI